MTKDTGSVFLDFRFTVGSKCQTIRQCPNAGVWAHALPRLLPMQLGDVPDTYADVDDLVRDVDYQPDTPIEIGIQNFVAWYKDYYQVDDIAHNVR